MLQKNTRLAWSTYVHDICSTIKTCIQEIFEDLKRDIYAVKKNLRTAIATIKTTVTVHSTTISGLDKAATSHSDITSLQSNVTQLTEKENNLLRSVRRSNIHIIGILEGK